MPITGFDFPGVSLRQTYVDQTDARQTALSVVCVGPQYKIHNKDNTPKLLDYVTGGATSAVLPGYSGMVDTTPTTQHLAVTGGVFSYTTINGQVFMVSDVSYRYVETLTSGDAPCKWVDVLGTARYTASVAVTVGSKCYLTSAGPTESDTGENITAVQNIISVPENTANITFANLPLAAGDGAPDPVFGARGVRVGDYVVLVNSANAEVVTEVLALTSSTGTIIDTITVDALVLNTVVADSATITSVRFCVTADASWDGESGAFTVASGVVTLVPGELITPLTAFAVDTTPAFPGLLESGELFFEYREKSTVGVNVLNVVESLADIESQLGPVCLDNPLGLACYTALRAGGNAAVYYTAVSEDTATAYATAMDFLDKYSNVYSVVICSTDAGIVKACAAPVEATSTDPESRVRRTLWYGIETPKTLVSGSGVGSVATADNVCTVTFTTPIFATSPASVGDVLKVVDGANTYDLVISALRTTSVAVVEPNGAITSASNKQIQIVRMNPTNGELVKALIDERKARTSSDRCQCVWADGALLNGETLPAYALAAAPAGMRAAEPCQRPLSNLGYSFIGLAGEHGFTNSQLKQLGAEGIWIIADNEDGLAINKRQVTTAVSNNINKDEESIVANIDTIALSLLNVGRTRVGCSNISPLMLSSLSFDVSRVMDSFLINETGNVYIGAQLNSWRLLGVWQDEVNRDHVWASIECEPPKPFNRFNMTLLVI